VHAVFLVDTDKKLLKAISQKLADSGLSVKTFSQPKEAIFAFIEAVPDVVVTDIHLPVMNGIDMIRQMRSYNTYSYYILYTALKDTTVFRDIVLANPDDLVDKEKKHSEITLIQSIKDAMARTDKELIKQGIPRNRRSAVLLRALIDTLPSGLLVLDNDDHVVIWNNNACRITSIDTKSLRGEHKKELPVIIHQLLDPELIQIVHQDEQGEIRYIEKTVQEISLEGGKKNMVVVFSDTTTLTNAKHDMEQYIMEMAETKDLMEEQAAQLAIALAEVDEKNAIIGEQNKKMIHELEMAGELQKSLLPDIYQIFNGVSFASKYIPSIQIGGDLYDIVTLGQGLTGFMIADVSGHGVAAALVASMFKMSFHTHAANIASPKILFHMLNDEIKSILAEDYITSFYLIVDRTQNTITYSNAGHPSPLFYRKATQEILELDTNGYFIGMFEDGDYEEKTISVSEGDAILLYTDCILETENAAGQQFGGQRLLDLFGRAIEDKHGQDVIAMIEADLRSFCVQETFSDDFTCLLLEFIDLTAIEPIEAPPEESHAGEFEEF